MHKLLITSMIFLSLSAFADVQKLSFTFEASESFQETWQLYSKVTWNTESPLCSKREKKKVAVVGIPGWYKTKNVSLPGTKLDIEGVDFSGMNADHTISIKDHGIVCKWELLGFNAELNLLKRDENDQRELPNLFCISNTDLGVDSYEHVRSLETAGIAVDFLEYYELSGIEEIIISNVEIVDNEELSLELQLIGKDGATILDERISKKLDNGNCMTRITVDKTPADKKKTRKLPKIIFR